MQEVIQAFHLRLRPDDRRWFDGAWRDFDGNSCMFNEALDPREVLERAKSVWGGLMLPDTLPILANGFGDFLCARFTYDGTLSEIIEWQHEGAHWRHYGYSIGEALELNRWEYRSSEGDDSRSSLLPVGLSPVAACEAACAKSLSSKLREACHQKGGGKLAKLIGVDWKEFRLWLPDPSAMPVSERDRLAATLGMHPLEMVRQDWDTALTKAQSVLKLRTDLAWPYAVVGRALERLGFSAEAVKMYEAGARKLCSSASFTGDWRYAFTAGSKFAVDRLLTLPKDTLDPSAREYVDAVANRRLRDYWLAQSKAATEEGNFNGAYEYLYAAGWDDLDCSGILEILQALGLSAKRADSPALEAILRLHIATVR
jgi:hypothetical protein